MKIKKLASAVLSAILGTVIIFSGCSNGGYVNDNSSKAESSITSYESKTESSQSSKVESSQTSKTESQSSKNESSKNTEPDADYTPAMWKVTKGDKEMYLFGSIHATQDGAENLPDYVQKAFDECDYLAMELDTDSMMNDLGQALQLTQKLMYTDGTTIKDHISEETYNAAVKYLTEKGLYVSYYDNFKPMMWISLLENAMYNDAGIDITKSMESIMTSKAKKANKKILEVENIDIQLGVFDNISDELADVMILSYTQADPSKQAKANNKLYEQWKHGEAIEDTDEDEIPDECKEDYEKYSKAMLTDRNKGMADKAEEYMNDGKKVFFMVGAAHMYGDDGIVQLLTDRGYTVERVSKTENLSKAA